MFSVDPETEITLAVRGFQPCPKCGCEDAAIFPTPKLPHYAKALCVDCGQFRAWVPHPDRARRVRSQLVDIDAALPLADPHAWDLGFLCSIRTQLGEGQNLSPNQAQTLDEVLARYLEPQEREWKP